MLELVMVLIAMLVILLERVYMHSRSKVVYGGKKVQQMDDISGGLALVNAYEALVPEDTIIHFEDVKNSIQYQPDRKLVNFNCHYGQRKLLLNEIQFHSYYGQEGDVVVYVGSAPCEHITMIQRMFPKRKYLMIDPNFHIIDDTICYVYQNPNVISDNARGIYKTYKNSHLIHRQRAAAALATVKFLYQTGTVDVVNNKSDASRTAFYATKPRIYDDICAASGSLFIIQDYLDLELIDMLTDTKGHRVLFISDLRTSMFGNTGPTDMDIIMNDSLQMVTMHALQPAYSMIKFHPPYHTDDSSVNVDNLNSIKDMVTITEGITHKNILSAYKRGDYWNYKATTILLQPWAPKTSTESRLIISKQSIVDNTVHNYKKGDWENTYTYINVYRTYNYNDAFHTHRDYCGCMDCVIEQYILLHYITKKHATAQEIREYMKDPRIVEQIATLYRDINKRVGYTLPTKCNTHGWNRRQSTERLYFVVKQLIHVIDNTGTVVFEGRPLPLELARLSDVYVEHMATHIKRYVDSR